MIGRDLVELGHPSRWIIDFGQNDIFYARSYPRAFARVEERVMPDVVARAEREKRKQEKRLLVGPVLQRGGGNFEIISPALSPRLNEFPAMSQSLE